MEIALNAVSLSVGLLIGSLISSKKELPREQFKKNRQVPKILVSKYLMRRTIRKTRKSNEFIEYGDRASLAA